MSSKSKPTIQKRSSKQEIAMEMARTAEVEKQRVLARRIFKHLEGLDSIYDAQTIVNAIAGYIQYGLVEKEQQWKVSDIEFDISKTKDKKLKAALALVIEELKDESAKDCENILSTMGNKIPQFLSIKHMKDPMSTFLVDEFIA